MAQALASIDVSDLDALVGGLGGLTAESLGSAALRTVNAVANRGFAESKRKMLSGVNLTEAYVNERMTVEEGKDPNEPLAKIIAFRPGGQRKPGTKPVNLRQYSAFVETEPTNWRNTGAARDSGKQVFAVSSGTALSSLQAGAVRSGRLYANPRKPGSFLPFKKRIGNQMLDIAVGQKIKTISVEVVRGRRKPIKATSAGFKAFMQRMPNGEILVMRRTSRNGGAKGKGNITALSSLSVWQLFNVAKAKVIPLIATDLEQTAVKEFAAEIEKAIAI